MSTPSTRTPTLGVGGIAVDVGGAGVGVGGRVGGDSFGVLERCGGRCVAVLIEDAINMTAKHPNPTSYNSLKT